ncbi:MAG: DUF255 domain-containing protein [Bacteroidota bacterium]
MKNIIFTSLFVLVFYGMSSSQNEIKWMSIQEALKLQKAAPKKIFIDVYTDWCGWCKRMDATTYKDQEVVNFMNKYFYAVRFNAEKKDSIEYKGKYYTSKPDSKVNDLAIYFLNEKMSYPTSVFLTEVGDLIQPIPGFHEANDMLMFLTFIGGDMPRFTTWENYQQIFKIIRNKD